MSISHTVQRNDGPRLSGSAAALPLVAIATGLALATFRMEPSALLAAWTLFAAIGIVVTTRASHHPFQSFGPANVITLARGGMTAFLAGFALEPRTDTGSWIAFGVAFLILVLDGLDGALARRSGMVSRFGARFDMEIDALLIMVLAGFAWFDGLAGAWILMLGLMRYVFVAIGHALPWLAADLAPSLRRKAVCVVQILVLSALLAPVWSEPWPAIVAGVSLVLLGWSFAVDIIHLAISRRP